MDEKALKTELDFFKEMKSEWLKHYSSKFALIHGRELVGTFSTFQEAYAAGIEKFGNVPMLIRQILPNDPIEHVPALTYGLIRVSA